MRGISKSRDGHSDSFYQLQSNERDWMEAGVWNDCHEYETEPKYIKVRGRGTPPRTKSWKLKGKRVPLWMTIIEDDRDDSQGMWANNSCSLIGRHLALSKMGSTHPAKQSLHYIWTWLYEQVVVEKNASKRFGLVLSPMISSWERLSIKRIVKKESKYIYVILLFWIFTKLYLLK